VSQKKIVKKILNMKKFSYSLADYHAIDKDNNASHAVRVCVYSLVLAKAYNEQLLNSEYANLTKIDYIDIAMAALLHDIGMACQDDNVLNKTGFIHKFGKNFPGVSEKRLEKITKEYDPEYEPYYAFCMLCNQRTLSAATKSMVLFSRENEKGTGPLGYTKLINGEKDIKKLDNHLVAAEIINLCSEFDKVLCLNIKEKATLENVQVYISSLVRSRIINVELIELLLKNIPLYPFGTKVQLAGEVNTYGIVVKDFSELNNYHRPVIMSVPNNELIDLRESKSTIVDQIYGKEMHFSELYNNKTSKR